ncbi:MAG: DUF2062 domain-containing protein [Rhodospirillaceae bacterium]|jgi:uncharacterized protein|nr:DUF2062 domain-containing protein [Rhodospirillaceae bacterium]MBT5239804.1 DUF2062 domain-containing protein [Rhodospirillaceae bacterium]MBT5567180.1 DUF2062 domain-containing protein [Rhodospirillaceae bacterium]MBT6089393.1 DUF2062 domain-containing protein [Rhodospirillaceae bacterium]MBT7451726.1 DUF2062 domain-containing protein [Rhodospirillaceae bacterium]
MFRRRAQPSAISLIQSLLWPKSGWTRAGQYLWHRLHRLPGTPHSIAAGLACGSAMSVTPFLGVHFFMACALAWLIRGNVLASAFGTVIGNPWTFPVIWLSTYYLGNFILGNGFLVSDDTLSFSDMFSGLIRSMIEADGALFMDRVWPVWWPMIVGSIPVALLTWAGVYTVFYKLVDVYQLRREARRASNSSESEQR